MRSLLALVLVIAAAPFGGGCGGCGDDDGASADGGGFTLVRRTPAPDDDNVWVYDPIVLEFSHPLDPESVSDQSIALEAAGSPVAHETALSEDGTTVTLTVSEPPATPVAVTVAVGTDVLDDEGTAFAGESWSFTLPVWQHPVAAGAIGDGQRPQLALGPGGAAIVGRIDPDGVVSVQELDGQSWVELGAIAGQSGSLRLAGSGDAVAAAYLGDSGVAVARLAGGDWQLLGTIPLTGVDAVPVFDLAVASDGNPMVAVSTGAAVQVSRWNGSSFDAEAPLDAVATVVDLALAADEEKAVVALVSGAGALRTFRRTADGWEELAGGVDFTQAQQPDVVAAAGAIAVSRQKDDAADLATRHAYAARWDGATWLRFAHAADLDIQSDAVATSIGLDGEQATMAWTEGDRTSSKVYAARAATGDESWTFLDSALNGDPAVDAALPVLVVDGRGNPMVAFNQDGEVVLARWNGSPTLRPGLTERPPAGDCAIPEDGPPATLAETGCYADVAGHQLVAGLIPFEINSPLWSDGALKRRFLLVPDGASIGWTDAGALTIPVGTVLVKEFWLERVANDPTSRFPVETRFLVKRCEEGDCIEPWQGYSYRWNEEGSEADLIDPGSADERTVWKVMNEAGTEVDHTHIYPARLNCTRCHNAVAGRVLGLQAIQLDRPVDYGGIIADQLDTLTGIGVLTGSNSTEDLARLPSSLDPSYDLESRSRAYYHTNCSHCHRPAGERPTIDFRFQTPLAADNICDKMTPGDGTGSLLYTRDATRGAGQMPPLATDVPDGYQLATTDAWIDDIGTCPH
jgi:hypothetical protein